MKPLSLHTSVSKCNLQLEIVGVGFTCLAVPEIVQILDLGTIPRILDFVTPSSWGENRDRQAWLNFQKVPSRKSLSGKGLSLSVPQNNPYINEGVKNAVKLNNSIAQSLNNIITIFVMGSVAKFTLQLIDVPQVGHLPKGSSCICLAYICGSFISFNLFQSLLFFLCVFLWLFLCGLCGLDVKEVLCLLKITHPVLR